MDELYVVTAWENGIPVVATLTAGGIGAGIDASVDINTIITRLTEIRDAGSGITQSGVRDAIDTSADIETIVARLTSINGKIAAPAPLADATPNPTLSSFGVFLQGFNGTTWNLIKSGVTGAASTVLGYLNVVPVGRYNATPPTLTDGQWIEPQTDRNGRLLTSERVTAYSIGSTTTAATGTNWVTLAAGAASSITVRNRAATNIDIRKFGETEFLTLANGDDAPFPVLANSNEWEIRRSDTSNTQVVIKFLRYA